MKAILGTHLLQEQQMFLNTEPAFQPPTNAIFLRFGSYSVIQKDYILPGLSGLSI